MSLDHLHPFAGQHAIQSAVFALDFANELDIGEISAIRAVSTKLVGDFPIQNERQRTTFTMQVSPMDAPPPSSNVETDGFEMVRPALAVGQPNSRAIIVNRTSIVVVVNDYTRWDKFKSDVDRYLSVLLTHVDGQKAVASLGLQFNDIFLWKADPADLQLEEVFAAGNPYLAPNVFLSPLLWHSHHGYFVNNKTPVEYQQLDNINVSRVAANEEHQLQILTSHRVTLEKPLYKGWSDNKSTLLAIQDSLHAKNKAILAELLTPEAQNKINLSGSEVS